MLLEGKTIVVTGAASGIGHQLALDIAADGGKVVAVDRSTPSAPVEAFHQVDLTDKASVDALISALPDGIDGLANVAGLPPTRPAADVVTVNLVALKHLTLGLAPKLADGASIVNVASLAGIGWPDAIRASESLDYDGVADFCIAHNIADARSYFFTKEALISWTMQNRWTWRTRGIRINAVSPGPVDTPILKDFLETLGERAEEDARVMDRPGLATDIAPVAVFLLSDRSGWIRGANIPADGGMLAHILVHQHGLD